MVLGVLRKQSSFETNLDRIFTFKLARELGMTVGELMTTMSSEEYNQWIAFYKYETDVRNKEIALADAEAKKRKR